MKQLALTKIRTDGGTQPRAELREEVIVEYAEAMGNGAEFPPVVVFYDGSDYWLGDGFHRVRAAVRSGKASIAAEIRQGTVRDAQWYSCGANQFHGLRRTPGDKKRAVEILLKDKEWGKYSQSKIAKYVGVSAAFVSQVFSSIKHLIDKPDSRTVTRGGTTYEQDTSNIGRRKTATVDLGTGEVVDEPSPARLTGMTVVTKEEYEAAIPEGGSSQWEAKAVDDVVFSLEDVRDVVAVGFDSWRSSNQQRVASAVEAITKLLSERIER